MVAAAFKGTLVFQSNKRTWTIPVTMSDVAGDSYVFPSGSEDYQLPAGEGNIIVKDLILSASGTDTSKADIYVNDTTTGQQVANAANVGTIFNRQFMSAPMPIRAGSRLKFKQVA